MWSPGATAAEADGREDTLGTCTQDQIWNLVVLTSRKLWRVFVCLTEGDRRRSYGAGTAAQESCLESGMELTSPSWPMSVALGTEGVILSDNVAV